MTLEEIIVAIAATFLVLLLIGGATIVTSKNDEFAGHPKGLFVLFFAEMWEERCAFPLQWNSSRR